MDKSKPAQAKLVKLLPSLIRLTTDGKSYYVAADPEVMSGSRTINSRGEIAMHLPKSTIGIAIAGATLGAASGAIIPIDPAGKLVGFFLFGIAGFFGIMLILVAVEYAGNVSLRRQLQAYKKETGKELLTLQISPEQLRPWRFCNLAEQLIHTKSWASRTVDSRRMAPTLLWDVIVRSHQIEDIRKAVSDARAYESLHDLARINQNGIDEEDQRIASVEAKFTSVLNAARRIDQRAERIAHERETESMRQHEEDLLRARLLGPTLNDSNANVENHDSLEGVVAEAEAIDQLLEESDNILRHR